MKATTAVSEAIPEDPPPPPPTARVGAAAMILGAVACLTPWVTPAIALALGMAIALILGNPFRKQQGPLSKFLLQASVVLLGFGMDLPALLRVGRDGAVFAVITISATLGLGYLLGRLLRVNSTTTTLISAGTAICGGSAIAAVSAAVDADESQITVSIGTVFLLNALALYLFPIFGHSLNLTQGEFGVWAGIAIHDVSSVVGAASGYGVDALQIATAVKLSRTLWILPITFFIAWLYGRNAVAGEGEENGTASKTAKVRIPWFIFLFVLASVVGSFVPWVSAAAPTLTHIAKIALTVTLFLIGAGLSRTTLKEVGPRALILGVGLWMFISVTSLLVILVFD